MSKSVFCMADSRIQAEQIVHDLRDSGFSSDDISILFPDDSGSRDLAVDRSSKAPEGAAAGAGTGGVLGGTLGWLAGIGTLAIPGVGPFIAAGPIMAALGGAAVGATVGGLGGALIGFGIPEYEAKQFEGKLREGKVLLSVHTEDHHDLDRAREIMKEHGSTEVGVGDEKKVNKDDRGDMPHARV